MPRPSLHRQSKPHPSPRFRDKVRLLNYRRGPTDDIWAATYLIDGKWTPRNGVTLSTRDYDEACETARDKYTLLSAGNPIARPYKAVANSPLKLALWAERAVQRLTRQAKVADAKEGAGKGVKFRNKITNITRHLVPRWGTTPLDHLTTLKFADWVRDELRVTGKRTGQPQLATRSTLGNIDCALAEVWGEAVNAKAIAPTVKRPAIPRESNAKHGILIAVAKTIPRAFIDLAAVRRIASVLADDRHTQQYPADLRQAFHAYVAFLATTGIRAGLEANRQLIGNVTFRADGNVDVYVRKDQGKHKGDKGDRGGGSVSVFKRDGIFDTRQLLWDFIALRRSQGATDGDNVFARPDKSYFDFSSIFHTVLDAAEARIDPLTGAKRVLYSFRHYYATRMIQCTNIGEMALAALMRTSATEIRLHYNRFMADRSNSQFT